MEGLALGDALRGYADAPLAVCEGEDGVEVGDGAGGIAEGVGAEGDEVGGVGMVDGGEEEDGVGLVAAGPVGEAVARSGDGVEEHAGGVDGVGAAADDGAARGVGGDEGDGGDRLVGGDGVHVDEGLVHLVEGRVAGLALGAHGEVGEGEVAVADVAPAPVDVEEAGLVVAVDDEGVAARGAAAGVDEGSAGVELVADEVDPLVVGHGLLVGVVHAGVVVEVVLEGQLG